MPEIRLQDYTAKIRDLVQVDRLDEAIAHCQHILRHYPKHVEIYCLLGEACLEKGLYREAIEFFQRTLSADPENLIARVGLGIIYDEQGAFPEAIWQMERAFELAPGNTEVRQELLRLCAKRDGVEKPRLKLTRGALGRLCFRNGLYERAINEFRAVLRQDPHLPDVRVAFAEALWREGRRLEAVEACQSLLDELPYCLKANLILGEIWLRGGHEDAGEERIELARALDPEGRIAQEMMGKESPLSVEEIVIPELEITADLLRAAAIPAGVGMPVPGEWEGSLEEREWIAEEDVGEFAEPWDAGEEMPDWLQEIGIPEEEEFVPQPEDEVPSQDVAQAEQVPDWLQELVIEEATPITEAVEEKMPPLEETPEWLREIEMEDLEEEIVPVSEIPEEEPAPTTEIPEWLGEIAMPEREETIAPPVAEFAGGAPESLSEPEAPGEEALLPEDEEFEEEAPVSMEEPEPVRPEADIPSSLLALVTAGILSRADLESALEEMSPEELEAQQAETVPDWLQDLIGEEPPPIVEGLVAGRLAEEVPDWLREFEEEAEEEVPPPVTKPAEEIVEPVAETTVEEIEPAVEMPAEEAEPLIEAPPDEPILDEELPDWLLELGIAAVEEEVAPPPALEEPLEEVELAAEVPTEEAEPLVEAPPDEPILDEELPDWLRELGMAAVEEEVAPPPVFEEPLEEVEPAAEVPTEEAELLIEAPPDEFALDEEFPDWLRELGMPPAEEEVAPPPVFEEPLEEVELAAKVPAEEAEPLVEAPPDEFALDEELPDWLRELGMPPAEEEVAPPPVFEEPLEEVEPAAEVPESLRALVEAGILDESDLGLAMAEMSPEDLEAQRAEAVPDWLQDLIGAELEPAEAEPGAQELPDWQREPEAPIPEEEVAPPPIPKAPTEEMPPFEEEVLPVAAAVVEEMLVVEEEIAPPLVEEPAEAALPVEEIAAPQVEEASAEEAPPDEEAAPPTELEMVAPYERVEIEEEAAPPARLEELLAQLEAQPRNYAARLELARLYSAERDWNTALEHYEKLIAARKNLSAAIDDLTSLTQEEVDQARVYQMLGDAYMQSDHLDKALEMYRLARQALANR